MGAPRQRPLQAPFTSATSVCRPGCLTKLPRGRRLATSNCQARFDLSWVAPADAIGALLFGPGQVRIHLLNGGNVARALAKALGNLLPAFRHDCWLTILAKGG